MAKSVTVTLSIPEPGDPLPHVVIENRGYIIEYNAAGGYLQSRWKNSPPVSIQSDACVALGIPSMLKSHTVTTVVGEVPERIIPTRIRKPDDYEVAE